jgi:hypothetical protein
MLLEPENNENKKRKKMLINITADSFFLEIFLFSIS